MCGAGDSAAWPDSNELLRVAVERGGGSSSATSRCARRATALDATVAYPHVDLRIAPREGTATLDVAVRGDVLVIALHHEAPALRSQLERVQRDDGASRDTRIRRRVWRDQLLVEDAVIVDDHQRIPEVLRTCLDCNQTACRARIELP